MGLIDSRPQGWLRFALRAPVWLYRHNLGWLFGHRLVYLATRGRVTGRRRESVLEVVAYDKPAGAVRVVSGWGRRSDWYQNLVTAPAVEIRLGGRRILSPAHRVLDEDESLATLQAYRRAHPRPCLQIDLGCAGS